MLHLFCPFHPARRRVGVVCDEDYEEEALQPLLQWFGDTILPFVTAFSPKHTTSNSAARMWALVCQKGHQHTDTRTHAHTQTHTSTPRSHGLGRC